MTVKISNDASTNISVGISTVSTEINVTSAAKFPDLSGPDDYTYLVLSNRSETKKEIVKCTALVGTTFTVERAAEGTSAQAFDADDKLELRITAGVLTDFVTTPLDLKADLTGAAFTGPITTTSTVGGRSLSVDGDKLDAIEDNAKDDQTKVDIDALGIAATSVTGSQAAAITANTAKVGITLAQATAITTNSAKVSNVVHPIVGVAVPVGAVFTDTVYDSTAIDIAVALNTDKVTNSTSASDLISGTLPDNIFPVILPAVSGINLTNLPITLAGTADFVASGTLPNGAPVILKEDGTVNVVGFFGDTTAIPNNLLAGEKTVFNPKNTTAISVKIDPNDGNRFVITYNDVTGGNKGTAIVGTITGTTLSFGTEVTFTTDTISGTSVDFDPNQLNRFVVAWHGSSNSGFGSASVGTISDTTISFETAVVFATSDINSSDTIFDPSTPGSFIITYSDAGNSSYGTAIAGTLSGTTLSFGTAVVFNSAYTAQPDPAFDPSTAGSFVVAYADHGFSGRGTVCVGSVSGTGITFYDSYHFETTRCNGCKVAFDPTTANKFVIVYEDVSNQNRGTAIVGSIAGSSVSFLGSGIAFNNAWSNGFGITFNDLNNGDFTVVWANASASRQAFARIGTVVDNTNISFAPTVEINSDPTSDLSITNPTSSGKFISVYRDLNLYYGVARLSQMATTLPETNLTATNFLGTATQTYTDTETATIMLQGGISTSQSELFTGSNYYVQQDGTLSTFADTPSVYAGKALSDSVLFLNNEVVTASTPDSPTDVEEPSIGGAWEVLSSTVVGSAVTSIDFEHAFDSTYKAYRLLVHDYGVTNNNEALEIIFKIGTVWETTNTKYWWGSQINRVTETYGQAVTEWTLPILINPHPGGKAQFEMALMGGDDGYAHGNIRGNYGMNITPIPFESTCSYNTTGLLAGVRFQLASGSTISSGSFTLIGLT